MILSLSPPFGRSRKSNELSRYEYAIPLQLFNINKFRGILRTNVIFNLTNHLDSISSALKLQQKEKSIRNDK